MRDLVAEGVTLLLTTQYLEEADALADRVVLIDHGRAVASGTPTQLKDRIGQQRIDVVAVDTAGLDRLVDLLGGRFELSVSRERRTVSVPAPHDVDDLMTVTEAVRSTAVPLDEIALRRPTLDDAFLALTGQPPPGRPPGSEAGPGTQRHDASGAATLAEVAS
jgi:ABC-type multidrug transport system ATPase subunit